MTDINVIKSTLSDHDIIGCRRKINNIKIEPETITCRDYKSYDPAKVINELQNENWNSVYNSPNTESSWNALKQILTRTIDNHAPLINKNVKGKKSPWLTREIKAEMNHRDTLMRKFRQSKTTTDFDTFKQQRNKVNDLVRKTKSRYHQTQLRESVHNPTKFWRTLKSIFPVKDKISSAKSFIINGTMNSDSKNIVSSFCSFFTNGATKLKTKTILLKDFIWSKPDPIYPKTYNTFRVKPVTVAEVHKLLKKLQRNKASGVDNLPPGFLKDIAICLAKPLCHVINIMLKTGHIPRDFKLGKVTPVFKSGVKHDMDNYRPITVLPACSKKIEKCLHRQVSEYLEQYRLLSNCQFGFRKRRNTELAATLFMDTIRRNMEKGEMTGAIFIDLSKAFDSLSHAQIVESLSSYGINGTEKDLLTDYLFDRKQCVSFNKETSEYQSVTCGVPQGSILGPLLFLIAFNNVGETLQHCKIVMYADDTVIFTSGKSKEELERNLTADFTRVADWMESHDLIANMKKGKTECMLFGTIRRTKGISLEINYRHKTISFTTTYKYLGVKLDQSLSLRDHVTSVYKKASGRLYLLKRVRPLLTTEAALAIYQSMIVPIFTYCSIVVMNLNKTDAEKVKRFEKRASEIIHKTREQRKKLIPIESLGKKRLCLQVFDCLSGDVCEDFQSYFEIMKNNTRNQNKIIRVPSIKLECSRKSFYFNGAKHYNELPLHIRKAETKNNFINLLDTYFLS